MITAARECPSCKATLPEDAIFCHKCGAATPQEIDRSSGNMRVPDVTDVAEAARQAAVQDALGETYEVRRLIGRGGFAEVYVAYDKRLKREIAVKTIRGDLVVNEMLLERFQREAEAVAKLRHPNVLPIYSVGETSGLAFFTMPLIEGESLAAVVEREGRLSVEESTRILREASNALHAAHRAGIVHRDVKPENIMLEGPERSAVVMDFGIAKSAGGEAKGLTGTGMLIGTPHYMSPEQAMGEQSLDARSDQYALAMVGYRMLTGRVPFEGASAQTLIFKTVTEIPAPAHELVHDVPIALSNVLSKALAKRPDDRYESMAAFAAALTQVEQASYAATAPQRGRRRVDLATRVREMRAAVPRLRVPIVLAVLTIIAAVVLLVVGTPRAPVAIGGSRDDALFAAKTFLNSHAGPARRTEFTSFVTETGSYRLLRRHLGREAANQRALTDVPVWQWNVRSLSSSDRSEWRVSVGGNNRIVGFQKTMADSAAGATISIDSARVLAERELVALGWNPSQLRRTTDSTIARKARSEHVFRWVQPASAIPSGGGDSSFVRLTVGVAGDRVQRFTQALRLPEGYVDPNGGESVGAYIVAFFIAGIVAVVVVVKRQQADELQWTTMLRLVGVVAGVLLISFVATLYEMIVGARSGVSSSLSETITLVVAIAFCGGGALCIAVAAESLGYARQPNISAGLGDLVHGRLLAPEMVAATVGGYAIAGVLALATATLVFASMYAGVGVPLFPPLSFSQRQLIDVPAIGILVGTATALSVLFLFSLTRVAQSLARLALVIPAALAAAILAIYGPSLTNALNVALGVLVLTLAISRFGLLTALLGSVLAGLLVRVVPFFAAGDTRDVITGVVALGVFIAPAGLGLLSYRKFGVEGARAEV